jgi:hypothetical protein
MRYAGFWIGLFGLGVGIAIVKYTHDSVKVGEAQVRAQEVNNYEMARQNSLEELSQGLITREEYFRRHPESKPTTSLTEEHMINLQGIANFIIKILGTKNYHLILIIVLFMYLYNNFLSKRRFLSYNRVFLKRLPPLLLHINHINYD